MMNKMMRAMTTEYADLGKVAVRVPAELGTLRAGPPHNDDGKSSGERNGPERLKVARFAKSLG
jgi:hypothetical protein